MPGVPGAPGAEPRRHWLSLPSTFPAGGRGAVACLPCRCGALRGRTCFVARLPCLWVDFLPPSPQPPSPAGKGETYSFLMQGASPLASPGLNPGGIYRPCRCDTRRGAGGWSPAYPAFGLPFSAPIPPQPPSPAGKGETYSFLMQGASPLASPALDRLRHLQNLPSRCPAEGLPRRHWLDLPIRHSTGVYLRHRQFGAKPIETPFFGQCRQPRRGGTGGDGTIRRKRRRRLRWSSPPGQGEPVPPGASPPQGTTVAQPSGNKKIPPPQQIPEWQDKADGARGHTPLPPARLINHLWYRVPRSI